MERLTIRSDICCEPENNIVYSNPNDPEGMYNILDLAECLYNGGEAEAGILLDISNRLAAYEDTGLTPEEVHQLKAKYEALESDKNVIESSHINAEMNLEAQQQEIDRLKRRERIGENIKRLAYGRIEALTADKDELAGTIMRLDNGLKKLRSSLQWLKETIHDLGYKAWAEDNIGKIDALLGGKENGK